MKNEIIACILLVIMLGFFAYSSCALNDKTEKITKLIDRLDNRGKVTSEDIEKIQKVWEKEKKLLMYYTAHGMILSIDEYVEMSAEYLEAGKEDAALHNLKKARHCLKDLAKREKIRLDNIF